MNKRLKILMLEDSPSDVMLIQRELEKGGIRFDAKVVETKADFENALKNYQPDLILADHSLPQFNSTEAFEIYKHHHLSIPFILVTGSVSEEFAVSSIKNGADDYLLKSNTKRLPTAIEQAILHRNAQKEKEFVQQRIIVQNTFLAQILDSQPIVFYKAKLHGNYDTAYITDNIERITGFTANEFIKNPALRMENIHPEDRGKVIASMLALYENGSSGEFSYRWKTKLGSYKWLFDSHSIVKDENSHSRYIAGTWIDFTQKKVTEDRNKDLTDSINYARNIQEAILPETELIKGVLPQSFIIYQPKDIVSGDFYWYSNFNNHIIVAVCDCTGHGVPGAMMSMLGHSLLSEVIYNRQLFHPADILKRVDIKLSRVLTQKSNEKQILDGMDMSICLIDTANKKIEFAGANCPLCLFRDGIQEIINGDKNSIGGTYVAEKEFTNHEISFEDEISIYMFSDGVVDQFGGEKNKKLRKKNFIKKLSSLQSIGIDEQGMALRTFVNDWKGNQEQTDDITMIGIKI